jgi:hypothetical protein
MANGPVPIFATVLSSLSGQSREGAIRLVKRTALAV